MNRPLEHPLGSAEPTREALLALLAERDRELAEARRREAEARERQTATSEILRAIGKSPTDAQPVFESIVVAAARLLGCMFAAIMIRTGDSFAPLASAAADGPIPLRTEKTPIDPEHNFPSRVFVSGETFYLRDWDAIPLNDHEREVRGRIGAKSSLFLPMSRKGDCFGVVSLHADHPDAFTPAAVELAESFRDQALIAIENARLFGEVEERTRDLSEALQQQTATADVLKVISRSAFDLQAVFDTLIASAVELCGANRGAIFLRDGDVFRLRAASASSPEFFQYWRAHPAKAGRGSATARVILSGKIESIPDVREDAEMEMPPNALIQIRATLGVPLLRDDRVEGVLVLTRPRPGAFAPRQVELVQTFADQAVIAIENARLFDEVKARTDDLSEALRQQTATAEVLKAISRSAFDLQTVFDALLGSAVELSGADGGALCVRDGEAFRYKSFNNKSPDLVRFLSGLPARLGQESLMGRVAASGQVEWIEDARADARLNMHSVIVRTDDDRALVGVPLLRDGRVEGAIVLTRREPGRFGARAVELAQTFADQAVIAIENARLFDEVQARTHDLTEALRQQTATSEVLKVISRSAFDLQTVLDTLVESAYRLSGAAYGLIYLRTGDDFECKAIGGMGAAEGDALFKGRPIRAGRGTAAERVISTGEIQTIPDLFEDPEFDPKIKAAIRGAVDPAFASLRSLVAVPMKRDEAVVGVLVIARAQTGLLPARQIELLRTFADQAVIAIENARLFGEVQARTRDLSEALQQQTATAEVLQVISRSAFGLKTVLQTLVDSAVRLCASDGVIYLRHGDEFRAEAAFGADVAGRDPRNRSPRRAGRESVTGRVALSGRVEQIPDNRADPEFAVAAPQRMNMRALLGVPLLRDGEVEGVFVLGKPEPGLFADRAVELVRTFADQAVIAIQNVRLFEAVQAKTRDLEESLRQQTATADVLKVISRSAFDLQAVFDTLLMSAVELVGALGGVIAMRAGDQLTIKAAVATRPEMRDRLMASALPIDPSNPVVRAVLSGQIAYIPDADADPDFRRATPSVNRSYLVVPLAREGRAEGVITLVAAEPNAFTQRHIDLVQTFADQAVIAIENVRLFEEVQARTRDLTESLQQQTATAEVLKVISRSAFDLQKVLDTLIVSAVTLGGADNGLIYIQRNDAFYLQAHYDPASEPAFIEKLRREPQRPGRGSVGARVLLTGEIQHVPDNRLDTDYDPLLRAATISRAVLGVPLKRDGVVIGAIAIARREPGLFTDRQIELAQTFADQAVIAIENVRLFDEVQARTRDLSEALQQQTATSDVLKVISRSAFDLQAVFNTLVTSAVELGRAMTGTICVRDGDVYRYRDTVGAEHTSALARYLRDHPAVPGRATIAGRVLLSGKVESIPDCLADPEYVVPMGALASNVRSLLGVPLLRKEGVEGAIILTRAEPGEFTARQIEIVQTFADQAVIALENVRLFDEVQARTRELTASLDDLRKTQDRLVQSEKLASLGQLTAGIAHEIKNPLNFVNNFSALSRELLDELREVLENASLEKAAREEADDLIGMVAANLDKVVSHGKRADSIVKNMLLHSREGSGERSRVDVNAIVEEALNLAYHGARAEKPGFNATIAKSLDPNAGAVDLYPQEITRVLLNLISNAFYATTKRQGEANGAYEPTIAASTRDLGHSVEIAIRDNGTGIPNEVRAKMFNPFFTTKPPGEGTGLGLSLSHDIVVKQHGGTLEVSTEPGVFTQFVILLPRGGAAR